MNHVSYTLTETNSSGFSFLPSLFFLTRFASNPGIPQSSIPRDTNTFAAKSTFSYLSHTFFDITLLDFNGDKYFTMQYDFFLVLL